MDLQQALVPGMGMGINVSGKLITSVNILQLSAEELSQAIQHELTDNPALEAEERELCAICGGPLENGACPECQPARAEASEPADYDPAASMDDGWRRERSLDADEDFDPMAQVPAGTTLAEYLAASLRSLLPAEDEPVIDYLIGSLDELGYLTEPDEEVAAACGAPLERVRVAIGALQSLEPIGIGARSAWECMLIQLRHLAVDGRGDELAERIVESCLDLLGRHKFSDIASRLRVTTADVLRAWEFMKANLTPFPAWSLWHDGNVVSAGLTAHVRPDVAIRRTRDGYAVDVLEEGRYELKVDELYPRLMSRGMALSAEDSQFIRSSAKRARFFIECIRQRWKTLKTITEALAEAQQEFLERGPRYLKPITRSELAVVVGLHESTVSRATNGKYVLLPSLRVVSFDDLFDASLAAKDLIQEIMDDEDPRHPLSDADIAAELEQRGIFLARRTVAKYRGAMHTLPSHLRTGMGPHAPVARSA